MILAQAVVGGMTLVHLLIVIIILAAVIAITYVALKAMGVPLPAWLVQIIVIVAVAVVAILAIRFVVSVW